MRERERKVRREGGKDERRKKERSKGRRDGRKEKEKMEQRRNREGGSIEGGQKGKDEREE